MQTYIFFRFIFYGNFLFKSIYIRKKLTSSTIPQVQFRYILAKLTDIWFPIHLSKLPVPAAKSLLMQDDFSSNFDLKELAIFLKV